MSIIGGTTLLDTNNILAQAQIGEKMKVASLGCGASGHFVFPVAKLVGRKGTVYAVDILKTVLEVIGKRAKLENLSNIKTIWSDLEIFGAAKVESSSVDVALLINTLHQSHKRAEMLRESARVIKKGGKLVVVEWKNIAIPFGPPTEDRVNKEQLEVAAKKLGLNLESEFNAGPYHYCLVFTKL